MNGLALCAGGGGLELGLSLALGDAYRTVCFVEREVYAASILVSRMAEGRLHQAPVWDDLTTFDGRRWRGCVDLLSAGFPCQPFSAAGKRQADTDDRHLWPHVRRVINGARPGLVFLENVGALVSTRQRDGRPAYMVVRNELERLGYRVTETLVRASDVGAPHQRARIFILGVSGDRDGWSGWTGAERDQPGPRPATGGDVLGSAVADTQSGDRSLQLPQRGQDQTVSESRRTGRDFPPGPGDTDAWATILAERPELAPALDNSTGTRQGGGASEQRGAAWDHARMREPKRPSGDSDGHAERPELAPVLEPALRGMADGVARALEHRTQRLRLLGNGVVPLAAAFAFRTCADALELAIEEPRHTHTGGVHDPSPPAHP